MSKLFRSIRSVAAGFQGDGRRFTRRSRGRRGAAAVEYALILSMISVVLISAIQHVGAGASLAFDRVTSQLGEGSADHVVSVSDGSVYRPGLSDEEADPGSTSSDDTAGPDDVADDASTTSGSDDNQEESDDEPKRKPKKVKVR